MTTGKNTTEDITTTSPAQLQREQQQAVYKTLDEARDEIRRSVNESRKEIPRVTETVGDINRRQ